MKKTIEIHETAFVTSAFRASNVALSKDCFAALWANEKTDAHAKEYVEEVSKYEPIAHCLRNRYFFETIQSLFKQKKIEVLINFGAGFSMYPFLLDQGLEHIEIDQDDVIAYKKERIFKWMQEGKLPERKIEYISTDFNESKEAELFIKVQKIKKGRSCFILIEGVLFFIDKEDTLRLFELFKKIQNTEDYIGSVSFKKELEHTLGFQKMISFIEKNLVANQKFQYQTINDDFYNQLGGYELIDQKDHHSLGKIYGSDLIFKKDILLNEQMYLLKKN